MWPPSLPHPKLSCRPGLQSGLDLEIGLCLLHGVFAQGSLSGEAYQLTFVNSYQLTKHVHISIHSETFLSLSCEAGARRWGYGDQISHSPCSPRETSISLGASPSGLCNRCAQVGRSAEGPVLTSDDTKLQRSKGISPMRKEGTP